MIYTPCFLSYTVPIGQDVLIHGTIHLHSTAGHKAATLNGLYAWILSEAGQKELDYHPNEYLAAVPQLGLSEIMVWDGAQFMTLSSMNFTYWKDSHE